MLFRRLLSSNRHRFAHALAVAGVCACGAIHADTPAGEVKSEITLVAPAEISAPESIEPADSPTNGEMELTPPMNSTLEMRIAKRPWLLEKLSATKSEPSQKMDPPIPPAELPDPPSMSQIVPRIPIDRKAAGPPQRRQAAKPQPKNVAPLKTQVNRPSYADAPRHDVAPQPVNAGPQPLKDPVLRKAPALKQDHAESKQQATAPTASNQPAPSSDKVIAGEVQPPEFNADKSEPTDTEVSVRELSIRRDGTPAAEQESEQTESVQTEPEQTKSVKQSPQDDIDQQASPGQRDDSQYVGDIDEPEATEPAAPVAPAQPLDYVGHPKQQIQLTRNVVRMKGMMQQCLRYYYQRPEVANERSNWGMMHSIMVYGIDTKVIVGRKRYSAIAWVAGNNACRGQKLLTETEGSITAKSGVGLQGHQAQLLAVLSLAGVPSTYTLYAGDTPYKVDDLIESEKLACKKGEELTFTLIGLAHYLETEAEWQNADGETWNFEKLIREELSQPIVGAACGGSHRLMGFGHALRARRAEGLPITGQWKRAEQYVQKFVQYTYRLQNRDGSMSTDWFEGREDDGDLDRKVQTTGHMVEWLLTVTPDSQLQNPRLVSAIRFLLNSMYRERTNEWKIGPKGHALRSLAMYYERVYQSGPAWQTQSIAGRPRSRQR